jgi:hypothetical protein
MEDNLKAYLVAKRLTWKRCWNDDEEDSGKEITKKSLELLAKVQVRVRD